MKPLPLLVFFWFFFLLTAAPVLGGNSLRLEILPKEAKQGDAVLVRTAGPGNLKTLESVFLGRRIPMSAAAGRGIYEALVGVDLDAKVGRHPLKVQGADKEGNHFSGASFLEVKRVSFKTQRLSLPPAMVDLDSKTLERVNAESRRVEALFQKTRREKLWKGRFLQPVPGEISTPFGLRRVINNQNKSPHSGVDLRAAKGTPVLAANAGTVVLVDDLFFSGKSAVLDHGQGIYSMYFHLSEILVREGERIGKGEVLGEVGSTGRSTGPHLHWGVRVGGARVDPFSLIRATEGAGD